MDHERCVIKRSVSHLLKKKRMSHSEVLSTFFEDELYSRGPHACLQRLVPGMDRLPTKMILPFYEQVVVGVYGTDTLEDTCKSLGLRISEMTELYKKKRLIPIIHCLDELCKDSRWDSLLCLKPPTELRLDALSIAFSGKDRAEWQHHAKNLFERDKGRLFTWSEQEVSEHGREVLGVLADILEDSQVFRYASLCSCGLERLAVRLMQTRDPVCRESSFQLCYDLISRPLLTGLGGWPQFDVKYGEWMGANAIISGRALGLSAESIQKSVFPTEIGSLLTRKFQVLKLPMEADLYELELMFGNRMFEKTRKLMYALQESLKDKDGKVVETAEELSLYIDYLNEVVESFESSWKWATRFVGLAFAAKGLLIAGFPGLLASLGFFVAKEAGALDLIGRELLGCIYGSAPVAIWDLKASIKARA